MQEDEKKSGRKGCLKNALHIVVWILAGSLYIAFNYIPQVGIVMIIMMAAAILLGRKNISKKEWIASAVMAICLIIGMFMKRYSLKMIFVTAVVICALFIVIIDTMGKGKIKDRSKVSVGLGAAGYVLSGLLCAFLFLNVVNPDVLMKMMQQGAANYPADVAQTVEKRDRVTVYRDVTYESTYPNNTYTVYNVEGSKGVFFYIHGGGLVLGDKENEDQNIYLSSVMDAGYSAVTVDYVLAPQNPFPDSVCEVNDALAYFIRHAGDYGLTTERIIVGGDSAGGMLSGLLAVINTNPDYAAELGVTPAVSNTDVTLKGYISISGLVDVPRFSNSGQFIIDWIFDTMARADFRDNDYAYSDAAHLGSVLEHVTADFPPTYASDGNLGSFGAQNKDLVKKLEEFGVPVDYNFPGRDVATLVHIWDLNTRSELGTENFARTAAFMDQYMK